MLNKFERRWQQKTKRRCIAGGKESRYQMYVDYHATKSFIITH